MKKLVLIACFFLFISSFLHGQTNAFPSSGNVGIGILNPNADLHIKNSTENGTIIIQGKQDGTIGNGASLILSTEYSDANTSSGSQSGRKAIIKSIASSGWGTAVRLGFFTSSNINTYPLERMSVSYNGNIGIGTTNPDSKLTVKGNIHTNEVKVDLLGAVAPDYVFYKGYDLKSLKAVEDYITSNGHLPNIPSAKDMETDGIMLKEMNLKLLEKIEELTLYAIEQEKSLQFQERKTIVLKEELQNQKTINTDLLEKFTSQETRLQNIEALLNSKKQ